MAVCLNHTDVPATTRCAACGKPICDACIAVSDNGNYCSTECHLRGTAAAMRSGNVISDKTKNSRSKTIKRLIWFFILVALCAAGWLFYSGNKKELDRKMDNTLKNTIRQTKKAAADAASAVKQETQDVKNSMPQSSKYKRNRESLVK